MRTVKVPKSGRLARAVLVLLLVGGCGFLVAMGVFVSQASELSCREGTERCVRRTHYPLGISFEEPVAAFQRVSVRQKSGRRGTSLDLTLHHADGTATEYPGVGTNGDRAAATAEAIERYMAAPGSEERIFALRSGSRPLGIGMLVLGLLGLVLLPGIFNSVIFTRQADQIAIRIERRPRRAEEVVVTVADAEGVRAVWKRVGTQEVCVLLFVVRERPPIELGIGFHREDHAQARARALEEELAPLLEG